ncbi:MAG: hypothetical protein JJU31_16160 [Wenzhouxiangella sp.]|nr:hypothetical protein [Wenzhouxiangella sp.]TVR96475.1 MAG: hypothetical protein EA418_05385 [Wenzhouxiangellaceae bacterium]
MPKILAGCLAVLFVLAVAGGLTAYFMFVKPAYDFATGVAGFATEYQELNQSVEQRGFQQPADGQITPDQFQRFLMAQRQMRSGMAGRLDELEEKWRETQAELDRRGREPSITELVTAYRDLGDLLLEAKRQQVSALNRYRFSLEEYVWVRNSVYRALGEEVAVAAFGEQGHPELQRQVSDEILALVADHREEIMEGYALAWFGL